MHNVFRAMPVLACLLAGCATSMVHEFNDADFAPYVEPGSGTITGQGLFTNGAFQAICNEVELIPSTPFIDEMMDRKRQQVFTPVGWDYYKGPQQTAATRWARCDDNGKFVFTNLHPGRWYVFILIQAGPTEPQECRPYTQSRYSGCRMIYKQADFWGGQALQDIVVNPSGTTQIALTEKDFYWWHGMQGKPDSD